MYGPFARFLRTGYRLTHPRWRIETHSRVEGPAAYIVHHQNMFGPVHAVGLAPFEAHIWALHCFTDGKACFEQFSGYTFTQRYGWPLPVAKACAGVLSLVVPQVLRSLSAIPVYHGPSNMITVRRSLEAFENGESVIICPDADYASTHPALGEMQTGFLLLGKLHRHKTGETLPFVPVYCSRKAKKVVVGEAIVFDGDLADESVAMEAAESLRGAINRLGVVCGDIQGG